MYVLYQEVQFHSWPVWLRGLRIAPQIKKSLLDSQSGHMPGLQARSPVGGVQEATTQWRFSPSFPLSLKVNK